jgi:hypothetical protein
VSSTSRPLLTLTVQNREHELLLGILSYSCILANCRVSSFLGILLEWEFQ